MVDAAKTAKPIRAPARPSASCGATRALAMLPTAASICVIGKSVNRRAPPQLRRFAIRDGRQDTVGTLPPGLGVAAAPTLAGWHRFAPSQAPRLARSRVSG